MRKVPMLVALVAAIVVLVVPHQVDAASIVLRTGVDGGLNPLGENVTDPLWDISVQGGGFVDAEVVNSEVICCGMETVAPVARWISDPSVTDGSPSTGWGIGPTAIARRTFDLTGFDLSTTSLSGAWRVADNRAGVFINGNLIVGTDDGGAGWDNNQLLTAGPAFFIPGLNVIELRGFSQNSTWDGFWLDATIQDSPTTPPVPEPTTVALMAFGVAAAAARARGRARKSSRI